MVGDPAYVGYCDASKLGAGGVWLSGERTLQPTVWRLEWPDDIRNNVVSYSNPTGTITNSDLEMAGMLIHFLALEHLVTLQHTHVAAWCDNTPTVSWTNRLSSSRSAIAGRLTRALALRLHANRASPLISVSIAGHYNRMADISSRTFNRNKASPHTFAINDTEFLHFFATTFPLQTDSWRVFRLSNKLALRIFSELRGETSTLGSWLRIPKKGNATGSIGNDSSNPAMEWTPCSPTHLSTTDSTSSWRSLDGSGKVTTEKEIKSQLAQFKSRFVPSARPSNWMHAQTPPIAVKANTGYHYSALSKDTDETTHQHSPNSPSPSV